VFKLVDSGPNLQVATAPTVSVTDSPINSRTTAQFTITNAATLNAGPFGCVVEWDTGAGTPSGNGQLFTQYEAGDVPTGAVLLPTVQPGTRVWVRARATASFRRASAWSAWQSVSLGAWVAPSGLTVGTTSATGVSVSWTVGNAEDAVDVYLFAGLYAPGDWQPYLIRTFPAGSTRTTIRGLVASTDYVVGVAHRDVGTGAISSVITESFTTASANSVTAPVVDWMEPIAGIEDAQYPTGIALGLWAGNETLDIEIQRAPDSSGVPGTWVTIATVPGSTRVFVDARPSTGSTFWYRSRHVGGGFLPSPYQDNPTADPLDLFLVWPKVAVSATPSGIPPTLTRPSRPVPSFPVAVDITATDYIVSWSAVGTVIWTAGGSAISPQPSQPWTIARASGIDQLFTGYCYAGGYFPLTYNLNVQGT
jgi:hypothetical protein